MKKIIKFLEVLFLINTFLLVFFAVALSISLHQMPEKKYAEVLLVARNLLISEIIVFLLTNYLQEKPKPMKTILNFIERVKSMDFFASVFLFLSFISIYYTLGFMTLYQEKELGLLFTIFYYAGVVFGFTCVASFTFLTYKYANNHDEDSELSESSDKYPPMD